MSRAVRYALMGVCLCLISLALFAAVDGYLHGAGARLQHPPGFRGMAWNTFIWIASFGPVAAVLGASAGLGLGLLRWAMESRRRRPVRH